MAKFKITKEEFYLAVLFAIMGFIASSREVLLYLNNLDPISGMVVYYAIIGIAYVILSKFGFTVIKRIENPTQILGLLMITFAFFIIFGWTSAYVQEVTTGAADQASVIFYQCEDGATYYLYTQVLGITDVENARLLTFVFTPFILTLIGGYLVVKPKLDLF